MLSKPISSEQLQQLRDDGFVRLEGLVPQAVLNDAKRIINTKISASLKSDEKDSSFFPGVGCIVNITEINNLFDKSAIPDVVAQLFGDRRIPHIGSGQIALRFPGDYCSDSGTSSSVDESFRKQCLDWHIDGFAMHGVRGQEHFGSVRTFNMLVGVLLSDVTHPCSGELVQYPGSADRLAEWFRENGVERTKKLGIAALPRGEQSSEVFPRPPVSCLGKAGDVFICNYLNAHSVAPNTSPDIRYAVYFRVHSSSYGPEPWQNAKEDVLMDPWGDWKGVPGPSETGAD